MAVAVAALAALAVVTVLCARPAGAQGTDVVRPGDTLSAIAARHGVTVASLARANGIADPDRIRAGRVLTIPSRSRSANFPARLRERPERLALVGSFERWARHYAVPADLLMALAWIESGWQAHKVSSQGAVGVGQLMPRTSAWMAALIGRPLDPRDPDDNIRMSARYLRWLLGATKGNTRLALAGYVQGLASVRAKGFLPVTSDYVDAVLAVRWRFA